MISLKSAILQPPRAENPEQLDTILAQWKEEQRWVTEWDQSELSDEHQKAILMSIMPKDYVKHMREHYRDKELKSYHAFEQELMTQIADKKLDDDPAKATRGKPCIYGVEGSKEEGTVKEDQDKDPVCEPCLAWSEEWQCYICAIAPKRQKTYGDPQGQKRKVDEQEPDKQQQM